MWRMARATITCSALITVIKMFDCQKCSLLKEVLEYEREKNRQLLDRLLGPSQASVPKGFDPKDYYGGGNDEMIEYDEYGQKIIVTRKDNAV